MTLAATCSLCGETGVYKLNKAEETTFIKYKENGNGMLQNLFPNVPPWIRSGAIDNRSGGFCICPKCSP